MYKDLFFKVISFPFTREVLNYAIRYTMSQPVEIDFMVMFFLVTERLGLSSSFLSDDEVTGEIDPANSTLLQAELTN